MSFVVVTPESLQAAAETLAGIRSSLADAAATAAGPTTSIAAAAQDEVSIALTSMFGNFGRDFQALSSHAQLFHEQFVNALTGGVSAYSSAEATNVAQTLLGDIAPPFQQLISNTTNNLQNLEAALAANPAPLLNQFLTNQLAYGQTITTGFQSAVQNFPAELANLPTNIEAVLSAANPGALLQQFTSQQIGYVQTIVTSLQNAGNDFVAGLNAFPANIQTALQEFMAGDVNGGLLQTGGAFLNPFFSGFNPAINPDTGVITISAAGAVGDLIPILGIPGQMAQNFTNLLPTGSIPALVAQNVTNLIAALTDTSQTLDLGTGALHVGLPLALALDAIGPPVTTLNALGSSVNAVIGAVQTGDGLGAAAALINAPAAIANGFLNGQATLPLTVSLGGLESITLVPLGGLLTPLQVASLNIPLLGGTVQLSGTTFGGLLPGLLSFLPDELARAIGALPRG
jgi:hypothetical protein